MLDEDRIEEFFSFRRQLRVDNPAIFLARNSLDQALAFKVIDDTCDVATADELFFGKFSQRERTQMSEAFQNAKLRFRQAEGTNIFICQFAAGRTGARELDPETQRCVYPFSIFLCCFQA